jgi:preprotein translocase subunit SecD
MLEFPRWKKLLIWLVLGFGVLCAVPSFVPETVLKPLPGFLKPRVNLGLDLSGGSHLLLEANPAGSPSRSSPIWRSRSRPRCAGATRASPSGTSRPRAGN